MFLILVNTQWLFWLLIYVKGRCINRFSKIILYFVFLAPMITYSLLGLTKYPPGLMIFYSLAAMFYFSWLKYRCERLEFNKKIAISFIMAYLLSYFWEFPIHFVGLVQHGVIDITISQAVHLLPIPFLFIWILKPLKNLRESIRILAHYMLINAVIVALGVNIMWIVSPILYNGQFYSLYFYSVQYGMRIAGFIIFGKLMVDSKIFSFK